MVPKAGIEPARLAAVDFESTASTDFATSALKGMRKTLGIIPLPTLRATTIRPVVMQVLKKSAFASQNLTQPLTKLSPTTKASNQRPPSQPRKLTVQPTHSPPPSAHPLGLISKASTKCFPPSQCGTPRQSGSPKGEIRCDARRASCWKTY